MPIVNPIPEYVLGFLFLNNRRSVVLIRKNKPEFQAGKLNGVGGRIESGEHPYAAMVREFLEETGKSTTPSTWRKFAILEFAGATVYCFSAHGDRSGLLIGSNSPTDEQVNVYFVDWLHEAPMNDIMPNLRWLVPMALSEDGCPTIRFD